MEDLIGFIQLYGSENSCRQKFSEIREQAGIMCKRCNSSDHYWLNSKQMWQCKLCRFRTSLRSGTMMESYKLPFHYGFIAIWFMGCNKKGTSARNVQRHLNHNRYEPIWAVMHKILKNTVPQKGVNTLK